MVLLGNVQEMSLPTELVLSINQILAGNTIADLDSLESSVQLENTLNTLFPDHASLSSIDATQLRLAALIQSQRDQTQMLQHELSQTSSQDGDRMAQLQELIGELLTQIHHLRSGATESEIIVREITRDIKTLDLAKRNIVSSMTGVKRYQMLVNGYDQLTRLGKAKKYKETAQTLLATKELQAYFKNYTAIDRIRILFQGVNDLRSVIWDQVMNDFKTLFVFFDQSPVRSPKNMILLDACAVVEALGEEYKKHLLDWYTASKMKDYKRIFTPGNEAGHLDNLPRRYAWFRKSRKAFEDDHAPIFPPAWNVKGALLAVFSLQTRDDLKTVLATSSNRLTVELLLESLRATTEFESEMSQQFGVKFEDLIKLAPTSIVQPLPISTIFEPYLSIFVDAQDRAIATMINNYKGARNQPVAVDSFEHMSPVLPSSMELFYFYRETLERCAQLSTKTPFLDLCGVFKKWLKAYSEEVLATTLNEREARRSSSDTRPNLADVNKACLVINTADYCAETGAQLEERLKEMIHTDLKERVSLEHERELFLGVISAAVTCLLRELEFTIEPALQLMSKSPWRDVELVSSESTYVADLVRAIDSVLDVVKDKIEQRKYIRSLADHVVGLVLAKFTQGIVRCRPISSTGAEQILLDLRAVKTCLIRLPQTVGSSSTSNPSYNRYVTKLVGRLETLLKAIMTPENPPEEFVKHYLALIPCQSFSDFQKMLDFKGVRRTDQNALLDIFLATTSTMTDLSDSSFLSTIDMDPSAGSSLTMAPASPSMSTGFFQGFAMLTNPSRDGSTNPSRAHTPQISATPYAPKAVSFADQHKGPLPDFKRFGSRLFGRDPQADR